MFLTDTRPWDSERKERIMNLKKATLSKTIADIRLYKSDVENTDGNSLPGESDREA